MSFSLWETGMQKIGSQGIPGVTGNLPLEYTTKQVKGLQNFPRERTAHSRYALPTTQWRLYTWTSPDGQYRNQTDDILCSQRWRSSVQSAKTRLGDDCGLDQELLIAKFTHKLKKVGKTTRPFRYDLNQIPYDYTVKVRNRLKVLNLIDRVPEKLWMKVHYIVQEAVIKTIPKKKNAKKENDCLRRPYK